VVAETIHDQYPDRRLCLGVGEAANQEETQPDKSDSHHVAIPFLFAQKRCRNLWWKGR
jgi:hypothetical protein